jgi:hypothetical protein
MPAGQLQSAFLLVTRDRIVDGWLHLVFSMWNSWSNTSLLACDE